MPNVILGINSADCAPVLALDNKKNIIAAIHMGWKSSFKDILKLTIKKMTKLGSSKNNISLSIGPCIGCDSYEVGNEFYKKFILQNKHYSKCFNYKSNKYFFNLPKFIIFKALENGIEKELIWTSNKDTFKDNKRFLAIEEIHKNNIPDEGRMISTISIEKS